MTVIVFTLPFPPAFPGSAHPRSPIIIIIVIFSAVRIGAGRRGAVVLGRGFADGAGSVVYAAD